MLTIQIFIMKKILLIATMFASMQSSIAAYQDVFPSVGKTLKLDNSEASQIPPVSHLPAFNVNTSSSTACPQEIITELPTGTCKYYEKLSAGYYLEWTSFYEYREDFASKIIFTENGDVYFPNFLSEYTYDSQGIVKGKLSDDEQKILVTFPQIFCYAPDGSDIVGTLYVGEVNNGDEPTCRYTTEETVVSFMIDEEGNIDMEDDTAIVLVWDDGSFSGFADYEQHYFVTTQPADIPQGVATEEWAMIYNDNGHFVEVGFTDAEVFIKGFSDLLPDAVMKGSIEGDIIRVSQGQLMGVYSTYFMYLMFGYLDPMDYSICFFDVKEDIKFKLDSSSKTISCENPECIMFTNASDSDVSYIEAYFAPTFKYQGDVVPAAPVAPVLAWVDETPAEYGETHVWFYLPPFNVDGKLVSTDNYYYNIFIDGDLYVLDSRDYTVLKDYGLEEVYNIPYTMDLGPGLAVMGDIHGVVLLCIGMDEIGIQSFIVEDGVEYRSEMLSCATSKIEELNCLEDNVIAREYYDIEGRKVNGDYKGLIIEQVISSEGQIKFNKIIRK